MNPLLFFKKEYVGEKGLYASVFAVYCDYLLFVLFLRKEALDKENGYVKKQSSRNCSFRRERPFAKQIYQHFRFHLITFLHRPLFSRERSDSWPRAPQAH